MAEMMPLPLAQIARSLNRIRPVTGGGHANGHGDDHGEEPRTPLEGVPPHVTLQLPAELMEKMPPLVGDGGVIPDETVWACTTCGWCEQACPVFIEHLPRIVDMRRNLVLMESRFPEEAARVFKGMETQDNPWGMGCNRGAEWCADLEIPVAGALDPAALEDMEYLFLVGCAGCFDDRQKRVSRALVKILRAAKVKFCILGEEETCNGDSARRLGNEYLFQALAQQNVETLNRYAFKKIVTQCPHCFNVLGVEYPQFNGHFKVLHHSEVIAQLVADGRLRPGEAQLEERLGQRINQNRVDEASRTLGGKGTVATSCPFCLTMIKDGIGETGRTEQMEAKDIAELVGSEERRVGKECRSRWSPY